VLFTLHYPRTPRRLMRALQPRVRPSFRVLTPRRLNVISYQLSVISYQLSLTASIDVLGLASLRVTLPFKAPNPNPGTLRYFDGRRGIKCPPSEKNRRRGGGGGGRCSVRRSPMEGRDRCATDRFPRSALTSKSISVTPFSSFDAPNHQRRGRVSQI